MLLIFELFGRFFLTGLFSVGGGLATLPFLYEMSASTGWFSTTDIANMVAVSESTPGPIGINMATYVGYQTLGIFGGIVSTIGLVLPAVIIILIIAKILNKFKESKIIKAIFYGLRPASTALIVVAGIGVAKIAFLKNDISFDNFSFFDIFNLPSIILGAVIFILLFKFKKHPIFYILGAAAAGIVLQL